MGKRPPNKMPLSQRAKQFAPFDALKGFNEAIFEVRDRKEEVEKIILSQEQLEDMNRVITSLKKGDRIKIRYYHHGRYIRLSGYYQTVDEIDRVLIFNGQRIRLGDIAEMEKDEDNKL